MNPRILATIIAAPVAVLTGLVVYNLGIPAASSSPNAQATSPVTVSAATLGERPAVVCQALVAKLPDAVRTKQRRPVTAGVEQNAAYGDPALTLQCGVAPATYPPTDDLYLLDDVCWHSRVDGDATVWTTVDREVPVRVIVPGPADGASQWAIAFSRSVTETVPSLKETPSGCKSLAQPLPASSS